ncbi:MAG: histidine ammonia-lyase [Acholeplasmatales bacterium]|nr:MAG: histidine ammonia-lyase [Acholeplasmatales bacterium]
MITLNGYDLNIETLMQITLHKQPVMISETAWAKVQASRAIIEDMFARKETVYGVNTGFGKLSDELISCEDVNALQENLLKSHACGLGEPFDEPIVRGMLALRINALIKGYSGVRVELVEKMVEFLNAGIVPVIYSQGSLGASGDLVPLAHMALPLIGLGEVWHAGRIVPALEGLKHRDIKPLEALHAKEGLALINGTQAMTSVAAHALYEAMRAFSAANRAAALSFEAFSGIVDALDPMVHSIRNQHGQNVVAERMRGFLAGSRRVSRQGEHRIQDAYALRCVPQVHGASLDAFIHIADVITREMNAATDNPVVLEDGRALSAGNFHGQAVALASDYLAIAAAELANISERRIERLVNPHLNEKLPPFLIKEKGLHSGYMIVQYAAASLVSENKVLCHPASVDSIPSSANQEDHVSMGTIAARKARQVVRHTIQVLGMEMMTAAQALDFRGLGDVSVVSQALYDKIRTVVPFIERDVVMQPYIKASERLILDDPLFEEAIDDPRIP